MIVVTQQVLAHRQTDGQTCYQITVRPPALFNGGNTASAETQTDDRQTDRHAIKKQTDHLPCLIVVAQPVLESRPAGHRQEHWPSTRVTKPSL